MSAVLQCLVPGASLVWEGVPGSLGDPLLDAYLEFVAARSRPNTVLATWFDLKVFFTVVGKPVAEVAPVDALGFITAQRAGLFEPARSAAGAGPRTRGRSGGLAANDPAPAVHGRRAVRVPDRARRRARQPRPSGLPTRRKRSRPAQGVPLVRAPRTLPRILSAGEVDALTTALRTHRDRETNYQRTLTRVLGLTAPGSADGEFCWM